MKTQEKPSPHLKICHYTFWIPKIYIQKNITVTYIVCQYTMGRTEFIQSESI